MRAVQVGLVHFKPVWRCISKRYLSSRASLVNPLELTEDHVSEVYCLPRAEAKTLFPHGLPKKFAIQVDTLGQACWVLRRQSFDIMKEMRDFSPTNAKDYRFMLYGNNGTGKTLCMLQVIHHCAKAGWMIIHIPSIFAWTHAKSELRPSQKHPGCYDQPEEASKWLKNFKTTNTDILNQLTLSEEQWWTKRESSAAGEKLGKVIEQGLLKPNLATEVVGVVLREVSKAHSRYNLLLAVDCFNGCFNPTSLQLSKNEWVVADQLNLVKHMKHITTPGVFPGAVLLSLSKSGMYRHSVSGFKPKKLLGKEGGEVADSCKLIEVPQYERQEMENCIAYYAQEKWINRAITPAVVNELWLLSSGNPKELNKLCLSL